MLFGGFLGLGLIREGGWSLEVLICRWRWSLGRYGVLCFVLIGLWRLYYSLILRKEFSPHVIEHIRDKIFIE